MEDLHHVGQRDQPGREEDLLSPGSLRDALAVPALEGLLDAVPDPLGHAQPFPEPVCRQPVILDHGLGHPAAVTCEGHPEPRALGHGPPGAEMAKDEQRPGGDRAEVGVPEVGLQRRVIAEPLRLLVGVNVASHPGQHGRVVDDFPVGFVQAHPLGQPERDEALAQDVLHRLTHAQVGAERQHAEQFGQADVRAGRLGHSDEYKPGPRPRPGARQQVTAI